MGDKNRAGHHVLMHVCSAMGTTAFTHADMIAAINTYTACYSQLCSNMWPLHIVIVGLCVRQIVMRVLLNFPDSFVEDGSMDRIRLLQTCLDSFVAVPLRITGLGESAPGVYTCVHAYTNMN